MTDVSPDRTLASLVEADPAYAQVFESLDLDYCCGGDRTLAAACADAGVAVETVRDGLADARETTDREPPEWESLADLADHVVETHHDFLREELPELGALVAKVTRVHGDAHPELHRVEATFDELADEMHDHIEEEETELFPVVEELDAGEPLVADEVERLREAVASFEDDHAATAERLDRIADLTDDYTAPDDACASYRSMLDRLERLERDTHMHVHTENNVLFEAVESRLRTLA